MRREAGAMILVLVCFLSKSPNIIGDCQRKNENASVPEETAPPIDQVELEPSRSGFVWKKSEYGADKSYSEAIAAGHEPPFINQQGTSNRSTESHSPHTDPVQSLPLDFCNHPLAFLSTAAPDSLVLLPGIGPVIAERIANAASGKRPFTRWEDLLAIKGIGPKKLENLKRIANQR